MLNSHESDTTIYPVLLNILKTANNSEFCSIYNYLQEKLHDAPVCENNVKKQDFIVSCLNDKNYGSLIRAYLVVVRDKNYKNYIDFASFVSAVEEGDQCRTPVKSSEGGTNLNKLIGQLRKTPGSPLSASQQRKTPGSPLFESQQRKTPGSRGDSTSSPLRKIKGMIEESGDSIMEVARLNFELGLLKETTEALTNKFFSCQEFLKEERTVFTDILNNLFRLLKDSEEPPFIAGYRENIQESAQELISAIKDLKERLELLRESNGLDQDLAKIKSEELAEDKLQAESKIASLTSELNRKHLELVRVKQALGKAESSFLSDKQHEFNGLVSSLKALEASKVDQAAQVQQLTGNLTAKQEELTAKQEDILGLKSSIESAENAFSSYAVAINYHKWFERTLILAVSLTAIAFFHLWEQKINVKDLFKNFSFKNTVHKIFFALMLGSMMLFTISAVFKYNSQNMSKAQRSVTRILASSSGLGAKASATSALPSK